MTSFEKKRDEFRSYLECSGVIDSLSKALIKLYEEPDKPENAVTFLRERMCEGCPTEEEFMKLADKYEESLAEVAKLEKELRTAKGQLKRSTSEIQLLLPEEYKSLQDDNECRSLLKKYLTPEVLEELNDVRTPLNSRLYDCISSGLKNHDSHIGIYAADETCYTIYSKLFDPIIEHYHGGFTAESKHPESNWGDPMELENLDPDNEFIRSTRIRCARSIQGTPFNPCMSEKHYEDIMENLKNVTEKLDDEFKGAFYPLLGMDKDTQSQLISDHFLFKEGDQYLADAGACRFWPNGRAIFHNESKTFLIWCCEEDHLRIISMENSGDLGKVYARLKEGVEKIQEEILFARDERLGYLTFCPTNLGTTIRASVHIRLPKLSTDREKLEEIAAKFNLQVRGTAGEHTDSEDGFYDISNRRRLGLTEFEAVKEMHDGIKEMIQLERDM